MKAATDLHVRFPHFVSVSSNPGSISIKYSSLLTALVNQLGDWNNSDSSWTWFPYAIDLQSMGYVQLLNDNRVRVLKWPLSHFLFSSESELTVFLLLAASNPAYSIEDVGIIARSVL